MRIMYWSTRLCIAQSYGKRGTCVPVGADSGKFGTHLSNSRAEEKSTTLAKGIPTPLAAGTLLRFGALLHLR